jgi:lipopolysaccharide assembly protein A
MKAFAGLLDTIIIATWVIAIAIFSIQNIQNVSIKFLIFESITVPVGILLAACSVIGMILGWLLPLLFSRSKRSRSY